MLIRERGASAWRVGLFPETRQGSYSETQYRQVVVPSAPGKRLTMVWGWGDGYDRKTDAGQAARSR